MGLFDSVFEGCTEWEPSGTIWTEWLGFLLMTGGGVWSTYSSGSEGATTGTTDSTTANYDILPQCLVLGSTASSFSNSSGPVAEFGPFWQDSSGDWHLGNTVPYSHVEKRAGQVYDALHGHRNSNEPFPVIVAESAEVYEAAERLLGGRTPGSMDRMLEIIEKALSNEADNLLT